MAEQIKGIKNNKENIVIEEFEYFLLFFSFNNEYNLTKKQEFLKSIINRLSNYYFPNTSLSFASNAIIIKQNKHSCTGMMNIYIENALFDDDYNLDYITGFGINDPDDISYFIIPVDFKDIKKYLVNYKNSLLDFFERIKC